MPNLSPSVTRVTRRRFHRTALGLALVSPIRLRADEKRPAPSDRLRVGVIGLGGRAFNLLEELSDQKDVEIPVVCDVDRLHYRDLAWGKGKAYGREAAQKFIEQKSGKKPLALADYRDVCQREDLDVIVIATPDHWHALCTLTALRNGKDVYCEKPITHTFQEGLEVCAEVKKQKAAFQTGSQQRSAPEFRKAVELVRNGVLGKILEIEVGIGSGYDTAQGDTQIQNPPEGLDYDFWCGPSPKLPYMRARHHRWWRGHRAFGGGVLMDWLGHHNDIAHWGLDLDAGGPNRVEALDWEFPNGDIYNTPWHYTIRSEYANGTVVTVSDKHAMGTKFIGENGWTHVTRGKLTASDSRWAKPDFKAGPIQIPISPGHMRNFIDCVKLRQECVAPAETAHRSITPGHLGYVSNTLKRALRWDAEKQIILADPEADQILRSNPYRAPWNMISSFPV